MKKKNNNSNISNDNSISYKDFYNALIELNPHFMKFDSKDLLLYLIQSMNVELNYYGDKKLTNAPKCNQEFKHQSFNFLWN